MGKENFYSLLLAAFVSSAGVALAEPDLKLAAPFAEGAVLQQGRPIPVWGSAVPGAEVRVEFGGKVATAKASEEGKWRVDLPSMGVSKTGRELVVSSGTQRVSVGDVLVGDVWLCSGQSNKANPVKVRYLHVRPWFGRITNEAGLPLGAFASDISK